MFQLWSETPYKNSTKQIYIVLEENYWGTAATLSLHISRWHLVSGYCLFLFTYEHSAGIARKIQRWNKFKVARLY